MIGEERKETLACPECGSRFTDGRAHCSFDGCKLVSGEEDPLIGKRIDQYEILERIGEGGMAAVYRVRHVLLAQEYALKMLAGELAANPLVSRRFLREAQTAAKIQHPNVVKVVYSGATDLGLTFLVMELIEGTPLDEVIRGYVLPPARAAAIARQIALGLAAIHNAGFVHRDIKPSNIMLVPHGADEVVKILDLGVVGVLEPTEDNPRVTKADHIVGTPQYMAPEALAGDPYHASADLYALGCVLYEMLAGRTVFEGSLSEIFWAQLHQEPDPLPRADGLEELAHQLLDKEPERRPQSATEVAESIDRLMARSKTRAVVEDTPRRALRAMSRLVAVPKKARTLRWWIVAAAALLLVVGLDVVRFENNNRVTDIALPVAPQPALAEKKPAEPAPAPDVERSAFEPIPVLRAPRTAAGLKGDEPGRSSRPAAEKRSPPRAARPPAKRPTQDAPPETIEVTITSDPPGAAVIMRGGTLGLTPLSVALEKDLPISLTFRLEGYTERKVTIRPSDRSPELNVRMRRGESP